MKHFTLAVFSLMILLATSVTAAAQTASEQKSEALPPTDLDRIKAGIAAPDFTLEDQDGQPVKLSSYRGKKSVVLVFYRGYW